MEVNKHTNYHDCETLDDGLDSVVPKSADPELVPDFSYPFIEIERFKAKIQQYFDWDQEKSKNH